MAWTRREILRAGATTAATALLSPAALLRPPAAGAAGAEPVLVALFLRGGADWLSLVPPIGDSRYYALRPDLAVPAGDALRLTSLFGFHPELRPLLQYYQGGRLAVLHACGSPDPTRSHFDAQDFLESGAPGNRSVQTGWLGRYAAQTGLGEPWAAVTLGARPARALAGAGASLAFPSIEEFSLLGMLRRRTALDRIANAVGGEWGRAAENAFGALDTVAAIDARPRTSWPSGDLAIALRDLSALIRSRIGVRVAAVDAGGWDHHFDQAAELPGSAAGLAAALAAFAVDLGAELDRTLVLVMTEFGRRVPQNGSGGTEHGRGGAMLAFGGAVRGGRVLLRDGRWPGLEQAQLVDGRDLAVTTDFRDVFAEALRRHMGVQDLAPMFPGFTPSITRFPGLF
jgi:uncharacterized protein (DUF1501 family)